MANATCGIFVLNNQFDIDCGLKVDCEQFFNWRVHKLLGNTVDLDNVSEIYKLIKNKFNPLNKKNYDVNFWDLILISNKSKLVNQNWNKFDSIIECVIKYAFSLTSKCKSVDRKLIDETNAKIAKMTSNNRTNVYQHYYELQLNLFQSNVNQFLDEVKRNSGSVYIKEVNAKLEKITHDDLKKYGSQVYTKKIIFSEDSVLDQKDIYSGKASIKVITTNKPCLILGIKDNVETKIECFTFEYRQKNNNIKNVIKLPKFVNSIFFYRPSSYLEIHKWSDFLFNKYDLNSSELTVSFYYSKDVSNDESKVLKTGYNLLFDYEKQKLNNYFSIFLYKLMLLDRISYIDCSDE